MHSMIISEHIDGRQLKAWIDAGETVELRESDRVVAQIIPQAKSQGPQEDSSSARELPDFEARHRKLFGDRVFNAVEEFLEYRHGRY